MQANLLFFTLLVVLGRMFDGRGSGGPKPSPWKKRAAERFESFFGRYSGSVPLPARPTDAAQSSATEVEPQPPPSPSTERQPPVEKGHKSQKGHRPRPRGRAEAAPTGAEESARTPTALKPS